MLSAGANQKRSPDYPLYVNAADDGPRTSSIAPHAHVALELQRAICASVHEIFFTSFLMARSCCCECSETAHRAAHRSLFFFCVFPLETLAVRLRILLGDKDTPLNLTLWIARCVRVNCLCFVCAVWFTQMCCIDVRHIVSNRTCCVRAPHM